MSDSTKRWIRTVYKILVTLIVVTPVVLGALPPDLAAHAYVAAYAASLAAVDRAINALEDAGYLPAWLRD